MHSYNLHQLQTNEVSDCLFGMKFADYHFFADDGFGNFISYGNETLHQLFVSTTDILKMTNAERNPRKPVSIPNII